MSRVPDVHGHTHSVCQRSGWLEDVLSLSHGNPGQVTAISHLLHHSDQRECLSILERENIYLVETPQNRKQEIMKSVLQIVMRAMVLFVPLKGENCTSVLGQRNTVLTLLRTPLAALVLVFPALQGSESIVWCGDMGRRTSTNGVALCPGSHLLSQENH